MGSGPGAQQEMSLGWLAASRAGSDGMQYAATRPPISISCGRGNLIVRGAPSPGAAVRFAGNGSNLRVHAALNAVVQKALLGNVELANRIKGLAEPVLCYTLGVALEIGPGRWKIPFEAFVREGE